MNQFKPTGESNCAKNIVHQDPNSFVDQQFNDEVLGNGCTSILFQINTNGLKTCTATAAVVNTVHPAVDKKRESIFFCHTLNMMNTFVS